MSDNNICICGKHKPALAATCLSCFREEPPTFIKDVHKELEHAACDAAVVQSDYFIPPAQGIKHDTGKPALDLIDPHFKLDVARVLTHGASKYAVDNWKGGMSKGKALAGVLRHLTAFQMGEVNDPETGISHLAHATCGIMFLHYFERTQGYKPDDRWSKK